MHRVPVAAPVQALAAHVAVQGHGVVVERREERHVRRRVQRRRRTCSPADKRSKLTETLTSTQGSGPNTWSASTPCIYAARPNACNHVKGFGNACRKEKLVCAAYCLAKAGFAPRDRMLWQKRAWRR